MPVKRGIHDLCIFYWFRYSLFDVNGIFGFHPNRFLVCRVYRLDCSLFASLWQYCVAFWVRRYVTKFRCKVSVSRRYLLNVFNVHMLPWWQIAFEWHYKNYIIFAVLLIPCKNTTKICIDFDINEHITHDKVYSGKLFPVFFNGFWQNGE